MRHGAVRLPRRRCAVSARHPVSGAARQNTGSGTHTGARTTPVRGGSTSRHGGRAAVPRHASGGVAVRSARLVRRVAVRVYFSPVDAFVGNVCPQVVTDQHTRMHDDGAHAPRQTELQRICESSLDARALWRRGPRRPRASASVGAHPLTPHTYFTLWTGQRHEMTQQFVQSAGQRDAGGRLLLGGRVKSSSSSSSTSSRCQPSVRSCSS